MELFYKPFDHQVEAIESIFYYYKSNKGNPVIVAPGGSGKTVTIAEFCRRVKAIWKNQKILIICDDQEINLQNWKTISNQNPDQKVGLYSASLKSRTIEDLTVAQIQSIYDKVDLFRSFNLVIVDEAHSVPFNNPKVKKKSIYRRFLDELKKPTIGFTATDFRTRTGYIHMGEGAYFTDLIHTTRIDTLQNIDPPRLCKISSKETKITFDASQIKEQAGDYILKELSLAFDKNEITREIVKDLLRYKYIRKKWLVYAIDIDHCNHICEELNIVGIKSKAVHSNITEDRKNIIENFRSTNDVQAIVSVAMLTTGVDIPEVDLIAILRSTKSANLHVQIILRGMRVAPGKVDCLVLDYAGNLKRNGPIDNPIIRLQGDGNGQAVMKVCENCDELVPIATRICPSCGVEFQFKHSLKTSSSNASVLSEPLWFTVKDVDYKYFVGHKGIPMLVVWHNCGIRSFRKIVPIEHGGKATYMAKFWWERRSDVPMPDTVEKAMDHVDSLLKPTRILVREIGEYPEILETEF